VRGCRRRAGPAARARRRTGRRDLAQYARSRRTRRQHSPKRDRPRRSCPCCARRAAPRAAGASPSATAHRSWRQQGGEAIKDQPSCTAEWLVGVLRLTQPGVER
jgi:hypothetical protein